MSPAPGYHFKRLRGITMDQCLAAMSAYEAGESLGDLSRRFGISTTAVKNRIRIAGGSMRNHSEAGLLWTRRTGYAGPGISGKRHYRWNGGRATMRGYSYILAKDHPRVPDHGYMAVHVLVAEKKIGRLLRRGEVAHHVNGNKLDNHPENIQVMTRAEHVRHHKPRLGTGRKTA